MRKREARLARQYRLQQKRPDPTAERILTTQLYVLSKYPPLTLEKTVPRYQYLVGVTANNRI